MKKLTLSLLIFFLVSPPLFAQVTKSEFTPPAPSTRKVQSTETSLVNIAFKDTSVPPTLFSDTYKHLSPSAFEQKMKGALAEGPLMFFRSFVNTYYSDLAKTNDSPNLILCLGDAHPENFGFIDFKGETRFVFNDLDDSGVCPIEYDILRYFTAVALAFNDKKLLEDLSKEYLQVVNGQKDPLPVAKSHFPNLEKKRKKNLEKNTNGKNFLPSDELIPLSPQLKKGFILEISKTGVLGAYEILDIAEVPRETGGSGGLRRYWLLVQAPEGQDILELKELSRPGVSYGSWQQPSWTQSQRLEKVKKYTWNDSPIFYHAIQIQNRDFLIRSRTKDSVSLSKLSSSELKAYLLAQSGWIASYHRTFVKGEIPNLGQWLEQNIALVKSRYANTFKSLKP
ncbi:DUF2252 family protein [Bdellovibrio sp.]|uniref:DUF2252 family protein n=1 Tax=Bdellovibrio sp. TaxID=28201 RepID=UPI0039E29D40